MAQSFTRTFSRNIGTADSRILTTTSTDAVIGIRLSNTTTSTINVDFSIVNGGSRFYLIKNAPIVSGGSLELIDGGSKFIVENNDFLEAKSDTASSLDCWLSYIAQVGT